MAVTQPILILTLTLGLACGDASSSSFDAAQVVDASPDGGVPSDVIGCDWRDATPQTVTFDRPVRFVGDVTGDGIDDWISQWGTSDNALYAGPYPGVRWAELPYNTGWATSTGGDINNDGERDLVVGTLTNTERGIAMAFLGPIAKDRVLHQAQADITWLSDSLGLSDRFADQIEIADLTGDDVVDLIVTAPGEGEEACFGARDTIIFPGPFTEASYEAVDAPIRFRAIPGQCQGHWLSIRDVSGDGVADVTLGYLYDGATSYFGPFAPGYSRGRDEADFDSDRTYLGVSARDARGPSDIILGDNGGVPPFQRLSLVTDESETIDIQTRMRWFDGDGNQLLSFGYSENADVPLALVYSGGVLAEIAGVWGDFFSRGDFDGDGHEDIVVADTGLRCPNGWMNAAHSRLKSE